jgi:hypothetical protein
MPQQLTCLAQLAEWLEASRNPRAVVYCLTGQLTKVDAADRPTLEQALADITALWCQQHGEAVLSHSDAYISGRESIRRYAKHLRRTASDDAQLQWAAYVKLKSKEVLQQSCGELYCLIASGALAQPAPDSYTGSRTVDAMLASMLVLPPYVLGLQAAAQEAQCRATGAATDVDYVRAPQTADREASAVHPRSPVAHGKAIAPPTAQHQTTTLQARMEAVMNYERARPFELLCALAYMSGRSMAELLCTGEFKQEETELTSCSTCLLFRTTGAQPAGGVLHKVNLLCNAAAFLAGLHRLHACIQIPSETPIKAINRSHCKTANTAAKALLGDKRAVFTDLRAAYVVHTFAANHHAAVPPTATRLAAWAVQCLPLSKLATAPQFLQKCTKVAVAAPSGNALT